MSLKNQLIFTRMISEQQSSFFRKPTVYIKFLVANKYFHVTLSYITIHETFWGCCLLWTKGWNAVGVVIFFCKLEQLLWIVRMDYSHNILPSHDRYTVVVVYKLTCHLRASFYLRFHRSTVLWNVPLIIWGNSSVFPPPCLHLITAIYVAWMFVSV